MPEDNIDYDELLDHWLSQRAVGILSQPSGFDIAEATFWEYRLREMERYGVCNYVQLYEYPSCAKASR